MNKVVVALVTIETITYSVFSQQDPAAKKILDKFGQNAQSQYPIEINFEYVYESLMDDETSIEQGKLILDGSRYRLSFGDSEIYCNGKILWNHLVSADEVYISEPEEKGEEDEFFTSDPSRLFTFYDESFKYRLSRELEHNGNFYYEVDLFPNDLNKSYHTVKLVINKANYQLFSVETKGKHGINHSITVKSYRTNVKVQEDTFSFNPDDFPGIEVIDTRL